MKKIFIIIYLISIILNSNIALADELFTNPLSVNSPEALIAKIITVLLEVVGSLALIMFIYGGFTWILSGGNEENVKKGKETLKWSIVGIIIIFASYAILNFVLSALEGKQETITPPAQDSK